jgi:RsbRD-like negative regulator of sigma factor
VILPDPARRLAAGSLLTPGAITWTRGVSSMRLAQFITRNIETILEQWEAFAATRLPAAEHMKPLELRDHAKEILQAIAIDLSMPQTRDEQAAKSKGLAPGMLRAPETAPKRMRS